MPYTSFVDVLLLLDRDEHILLAQRMDTGYADGGWNPAVRSFGKSVVGMALVGLVGPARPDVPPSRSDACEKSSA